MNILVVGGGGREDAIVRALASDPQRPRVLCAPGNGGIANSAECFPEIKATDIKGLLELAKSQKVDHVIVGPEAPLVDGIVDQFLAEDIPIFGPTRQAAMIEGSKVIAKLFMWRHGIPTAPFAIFTDADDAQKYLYGHFAHSNAAPVVIKADGLCGGKGVTVAANQETAFEAIRELMVEKVFGPAGEVVVIEKFLEGQECSVIAVTDGINLLVLPPARDYKRAYNGDNGPNTGGMGAYSPDPALTPEFLVKVETEILQPTITGLQAEGCPFRGFLYAGLMLTNQGPRVLEFNCRLGDPEAQVILPRLQSSFLDLIKAASSQNLRAIRTQWSSQVAVCVVLTAEGYPAGYRTGFAITGIEGVEAAIVYHAGTARSSDGRLLTAGGRILDVVGLADTFAEAQGLAYAAADCITFAGKWHRDDIARGVSCVYR